MSTVLSLALKISSDASALKLDPVQRALQSLGDQTDKLSGQFDKFTSTVPGAAAAQQDFADRAQDLVNSLRDGEIGATQFAIAYGKLETEASAASKTFADAAAIMERNRSAADKFDEGVVSLNEHLDAGRITQEAYTAEVEKLAKGMTAAEREARGLAATVEETSAATKDGNLQFNELSGLLGLLPGPFGAIAARASSLSSSMSGLQKLFSGDLASSTISLGERFTALGSTISSSFAGLTSLFTGGGGITTALSGLLGSVTALINPFTLLAGGIAAVGFAASSVFSGLKSMEGEIERLTNSANKLGVSFEFLEDLKQTAEQSGIEFGTVNAAMTRLLRTLAGADEESKKAANALNAVGLSLDDIKGKNSEEQIKIVGERLKGIEDPAKRAAAATAIFGRAGAELLPVFENFGSGATTLDRFNARVAKLDRDRVLALGDAFDSLTASFKGIGNELLTPFIGITESITGSLASAFAAFGRNIGALLDIISPITSAIGLVVNVIIQFSSVVTNAIGTALEPFAAYGRVLSSVFDAVSRAVTEFFGRINDAIIAVREFFKFNGAAEYMNKLFTQMWEVVERVGTIIVTAFSKAGEAIGGLVSWFLEFTGLTGAIEYIGSMISSVFGSVSSIFSTIANAIGGVVGRLLTMAENFLGIERPAKTAAEATGEAAEKTAEMSKEQKKAMEEVNKELEKSQQALNKGIESAGQYGQEGFEAAYRYQEALKEIDDMLKEGEYSAEQHARAVANATKEFDKQMDAVKKNADEKKRLADEAQKQADEITKKVDGLLAKQNQLSELEQNINAIDTEIARVQAAQAAAREAGDTQAVNALTRRLAELDQLQASFAEKADQAAQGFTDGFDKAFAETNKGMSSLIDKAAEFGQAGVAASVALQEGIARAQEQVKDGILNKEAYEKEVERQKKLFEKRVEDLKKAEKVAEDITKKQDDLAAKKHEIDVKRAEDLANAQTGAIKTNDLRSGGTAELFAAMKEDPAIAEAKKQTKELEKIQKEIAKLQAQRVDILAGTG